MWPSYDRTETIEGLTLSIWGENPQTSLAIGIVNGTTGDSAGLSWGWLVNYADNYKGVQWALINYAKDDFIGWQGGVHQLHKGSMKGFQSGTVNYADRLKRAAARLINYAEDVDAGVQIGLAISSPENRMVQPAAGRVGPGDDLRQLGVSKPRKGNRGDR